MIKISGNIKKIATIALSLIIMAGLILILDINKLASSFNDIDLKLFLLAFSLMPAFVLLKSYRWYYLVKSKANVTIFDAIRSYLAGNCIGLLTPARAGELSRVLYLPVKNKGVFMGVVMIDRLFDVAVMVMFSCIGSTLIFGQEITILLTVLFLIFIIAIFSFKMIYKIISKHDRFSKNKLLLSFTNIISMDIRGIIVCFIVTLLSLIVTLFQFYLIVIAFEPVDIKIIFLVVPLIILTNVLPLTIGGLGIREGASILLLSGFGVSDITAFNAAFLMFFINTFIPDMIGAFWVNKIVTVKDDSMGVEN
jgi:hypothetical protein